MAKWVFCAETNGPRRVDNETAAEMVEKGVGRYLGKYEAARMLAAVERKGAHDAKDTNPTRGTGGHRAR